MPVRGAIRNRRSRGSEHGAIAIQTLVILVPVLLVFGGFAVDLGRMYVVRAELKQAANAAALAAAANLWGTEAAQANAEAAALRATTATEGDRGNRFDFAGQSIGNSSGNLVSSVSELQYFDLAADAVSSEGASTSGTTAKYVRVTVNAEAPLIFFSLLNQGQDRKTAIVATATAGISAPLCQACGIEPMAKRRRRRCSRAPRDWCDSCCSTGTTARRHCSPMSKRNCSASVGAAWWAARTRH